MKDLALVAALLLTLVGCSTSGDADVVLETDTSPLTDAERLNISSALGEIHQLELVGRVTGPQGESILVTFGEGEHDSCYGVVEDTHISSGCGSLEPPLGSVVIGQSTDDGYTGLVIDTSEDAITSIRVSTGTGESYEVAPLGDISFIAFEDTQSGFEVSLLAGDEIIAQR